MAGIRLGKICTPFAPFFAAAAQRCTTRVIVSNSIPTPTVTFLSDPVISWPDAYQQQPLSSLCSPNLTKRKTTFLVLTHL